MEAEFNDERKSMLMASAESDKIKAMMNEQYGPGTIKYGSEIPQPEIKTPQAAFEFSQRNPAAEGGRMGFDKGLGVEKRKIYKVIREITEVDRIQAANKGNPIPKDAKYKVQLPSSEMKQGVMVDGKLGELKKTTGTKMQYAKTKKILQKAIDASDDYVANVMNAENSARKIGNKDGFQIGNKTGLQFGQGQTSSITPEMIKVNTDIIDEIAKTKSLDVKKLAKKFDMSLKDMNQKLSNFTRAYYKNRIGEGGVYLNKYDDNVLSDVLGKLNASDFKNQYERTMTELVSNAYPKGSKNLTAAIDNVKNYHKVNLLIAEKFPSLYSTLDHSVPYTYIRDITEAGGNPKNLIKVRPLPKDANTFKTLIDRRSIDLGKKLKANPKDAELLKDFKNLNSIKKQIPLEFGTTTSTGKVVSYANQALSGKTDLVDGIVKGNTQFNELIDFSKNLDPESDLAKLLTKSEKKQLSKISTVTKVDDKELKQFIESVGCPNGVLEAASGGNCLTKGTELINNGMKGATPAAAKNFTKFANTALRYGKNIMKFGIIPEAIYVGAETAVRMGMGDSFSQASKQALGFYLDPILGTNFKKEGAFSKMESDVGTDMAFDVAKLNEYKESLAKVESIKSNKENVLATNDESLSGQTDQAVAAQYDKFIAKAEAELNKRMLSETERIDFENKADTAADVAGVNSPIRQFIGNAKNNTELMRVENDPTGMQSDMIAPEVTQKDLNKKMLPQKQSNMYNSNFMKVGQLPLGPRLPSEMDLLAERANKDSNKSNSEFAAELKQYQDYLKNEKNLSFADQARIFGKEQTYGTQGNFFGEKIKQTPMYDYAEGGITGLRSKYEYKK
jgi:hypothetical protein